MTDPWAAHFPRLFSEQYVDYADAVVTCTSEVPPDALVARLHMVAHDQHGNVVVCRSRQGWRFLPGGTREPAETVAALARRELMEEAGVELEAGPSIFASLEAHLRRPQPHRAHLPHPIAHWAFATARVLSIGPPTNPPDGEDVVEVLALPSEQAAAWLDEYDPTHGDMVRLAVKIGLLRS
ncbi:hypothetical protein ASG90_17825 [Nocardioides sp. Soil797]|nr:hypothetical protein ASG90_17825 [Nocardioides sp. Soil797]